MTSNQATTRTILRSDELSCPSCVAKIEKALLAVDGVKSAKVQFGSGKIEVEHAPHSAGVAALVNAVQKAGYAARPSPF